MLVTNSGAQKSDASLWSQSPSFNVKQVVPMKNEGPSACIPRGEPTMQVRFFFTRGPVSEQEILS